MPVSKNKHILDWRSLFLVFLYSFIVSAITGPNFYIFNNNSDKEQVSNITSCGSFVIASSRFNYKCTDIHNKTPWYAKPDVIGLWPALTTSTAPLSTMLIPSGIFWKFVANVYIDTITISKTLMTPVLAKTFDWSYVKI